MDMKKILQAMDGVSSKPVEGSNDMAKFMSIVTEGANPHKVALPVQMAMQHYQQPAASVQVKEPSLLKKYFTEAEDEVATQLAEEEAAKRQRMNMYAQKIANRVLMKESKLSEDEAPAINRLTGRPLAPQTTPAPAPVAPADPSGSPFAHFSNEYLQKAVDAMNNGVRMRLLISGPDAAAELQRRGVVNEAPIDMSGDPNDPTVYGHQQANPMSLKGRIGQARAQLKELAQLAESNELVAWERICKLAKGGMFMGLEQNLEQIRHGIEQLAAKRKQGGVASRGIDKNISERSVSQAQAHLMAAAAHNPEFAKKVKMKQSVAKEFNKADTGKNIKSLPSRVPKKK